MYPLFIVLNLLLFLIVSLILVGFGSKILRIFNLKTPKPVEFALSFALGYGIFGYFLYFLGLLGLFYFWLIWPLLLLIGLLNYKEIIFWLKKIIFFFRHHKISSLVSNKINLVFVLLILIWLVILFHGTTSPLIGFDSRWYHFAEAKYYLDHHRISIETAWKGNSVFWTSAYPRLAEIFFALFLSFKGEIAAKLINLAFGLLGILAIYYFTRRKAGYLAGLTASLVILFSPAFAGNAVIGYIDLIAFGYSVLALFSFFIWLENKERNWLILAGIMTGLTASIKLNCLLILPIISIIILLQGLFFSRNWRKILIDLFLYLFFSFLFCFAWYLDSRLHTGTFLFAFSVVKLPLFSEGNLVLRVIKDFFALFLSFPLAIFFIFGFDKKFFRISLFLVISFLLIFIFCSIYPVNDYRFLLVGMFGLAVVSGIGFAKLQQQNKTIKIASLSFVFLVLAFEIIVSIPMVKRFMPHFIGLKTRHDYLTEVIAPDWWTVYDYNGEIKKVIGDSRALIIPWHTYYIDFPAEHISLSRVDFETADSISQLAARCKEKGYGYVIAKNEKGDLDQFLETTLIVNKITTGSGANPDLSKYFSRIYFDPYSGIIIYKIN